MDKRNRRNDNGTAAVLAALLAGVSAIVVLGGALFFLSEEGESDGQVSATESTTESASECEEDDIACLADEAGVSETVYLAQICAALGGTDCGASAQVTAPSNSSAGASQLPDDEDEDVGGDDEADPGDAGDEDEEDEPEADPEEEPEGGLDDEIIVLDPEVLYCFFDADSDGLFNCEEETYGTDPNFWDTDGDGLGDGIEVGSGLGDPLLPDTDNDALSDYQEMMYGTNPWSSDSDGDGSSDSGEIFWGTDPLDPDDEPLDWWF